MFIEINKLFFRYLPGQAYVIKDLSLSIPKGITLAILGESGSGKSTILRLLAGLELPEQGEIKINGRLVASPSTFIPPEDRHVGMVFQDYALFPHFTVEANIGFGLNKLSKKDRNTRIQNVLALVDMLGFEKRYPHELSGGQQQRIALARALVYI